MKKNTAYILMSIAMAYLLLYLIWVVLKVGKNNYIANTVATSLAWNCEVYYKDNNHWPENVMEREDWCKDSYNHPFVYQPYNEASKYGAIISYGRDNKPGGSFWSRDVEIRFPLDQWNAWNEEHKPWAIAIR